MIKIGKKNNKMFPIRRENSFTRNIENPQLKSIGAFDEDVQVGYRNQKVERISDNIIDDLYYGNSFFKRIIDEIPSDSLKKGFKIDFAKDNEKISDEVYSKFLSLELDNYLIEFIQHGRKDGFSALLPICKVNGNMKTDEELLLPRLNEILDFNIIKKSDISQIERNNDITKPFYGNIEYIYIKKSDGSIVKYHHSWLLIFETGITTDKNNLNQMHQSIYTGLFDALQVNYNIGWSTGQYAFASFCKVLQIGDQNELNKIRKNGLNNYIQKKEMEVNSSTLAVIGENDKLESINLSGNTDFESLQKVSLNDIATRLGIPVSKLMGASAGALASAEQDAERYIEVVEQYQNVTVKDFIRKVINMILATMKRYNSEYEVIFNSIKVKDEKKEAEKEKLEAEKEKIKAESLKTNVETLIALNQELKDDSITNILKNLAEKLKDSILEDLNLDED